MRRVVIIGDDVLGRSALRRPFIAGNWKMNLTCAQAKSLADELKATLRGVTDREIGIFPTFVSLTDLSKSLDGTNIRVGGQNCSHESDGALTGEVSAAILRSTGATHVIIGHSERRHILGESDGIIQKKVGQALRHHLSPILCVGETLDQRESGETAHVIERQVRHGLAGFGPDDLARITIAYEPVWAIGTGKTASPDQAQTVHAHIRGLVAEIAARNVAESMRILYGGSVKATNVDGLMAMPDIDGALVGGASLEVAAFTRIVRFEAAT